MKLLDRKTINTQKTDERLIEIKEGLKLAKKVDALREAASTEEARLAKFRTETLQLIKGEIDGCIRQRDLLLNEIKELEEKKLSLKKTLKEIIR